MTTHWREADIKRAIGAAEKSRLRSYRIDIAPDGTISIVVGATAQKHAGRNNSCDDLLNG